MVARGLLRLGSERGEGQGARTNETQEEFKGETPGGGRKEDFLGKGVLGSVGLGRCKVSTAQSCGLGAPPAMGVSLGENEEPPLSPG